MNEFLFLIHFYWTAITFLAAAAKKKEEKLSTKFSLNKNAFILLHRLLRSEIRLQMSIGSGIANNAKGSKMPNTDTYRSFVCLQ